MPRTSDRVERDDDRRHPLRQPVAQTVMRADRQLAGAGYHSRTADDQREQRSTARARPLPNCAPARGECRCAGRWRDGAGPPAGETVAHASTSSTSLPNGVASGRHRGGEAVGRCERALDEPQQQRNADEEHQRAADAMQDRNDRRQRLADREEVEVDRARFVDGTIGGGHASASSGACVAKARKSRTCRRATLRLMGFCTASNYSRMGSQAHWRAIQRRRSRPPIRSACSSSARGASCTGRGALRPDGRRTCRRRGRRRAAARPAATCSSAALRAVGGDRVQALFGAQHPHAELGFEKAVHRARVRRAACARSGRGTARPAA